MSRKLYSGKIPFLTDKKIQVSFVEYYMNVDERENQPFEAWIEIMDYGRGRSSAVFLAKIHAPVCRDKSYEEKLSDCFVTIFMSDMLEILRSANFHYGCSQRIRLAFCKKGSNYGLCLYEPDADL